ncbi:TetR/AcrR family transcriptional regulator [Cupriavidus taiwanensis]|uniref:TetR/AcrR family transcriptional regulator n=1 Tax=Cupriavidus taiwanensis TaxID=164546 RepID=UPI000E153FFC|nr:TetR/AcrR family transcriptional regulator [Cupriavidus taiwanensis]SOZ20785.1 putative TRANSCRIPTIONal REGULATOR, TetR family [Cupriavidus taiwanensis]SPA25343.1 putative TRANSCRIPTIONal REGULATOR, TetR family [Cupriavidus taiwanensis]SPA43770.1 putative TRANSCRIPTIONal REGULATOR, TetR family [Cupriavidus taiwanensis]
MKTGKSSAGDTKARILDATEKLFTEVGYEATSLRQVTSRAIVNLAAVNYHFRSKDIMMHAVLSRRLDPLNARRLALLDACEARWPGHAIRCEHVMGALFVPALQMARDPAVGGPSFLRLLGRVYSDTSPFIQQYLLEHYAPVYGRFFDAFARAIPALPRQELGWRLQFALKALAGVLAGEELASLLPAFTQGRQMSDAHVLAQLTAMVEAVLNVAQPGADQLAALQSVFELGEQQSQHSGQHSAQRAGSLEAQPADGPDASVAALAATMGDAASHAAALGKARTSARIVRNAGTKRAAAVSSVTVGAREHTVSFPSNPLDDWMRMRTRT